MVDYLYYKRADEWVRVQADTFTQMAESDPNSPTGGQCDKLYLITVYTELLNYPSMTPITNGNATVQGNRVSIQGPITRYEITYDQGGRQKVYNSHGESSNAGQLYNSSLTYGRVLFAIYEPRDGTADDCGAAPAICKTRFYQAGTLVLTLDSCPEVSAGDGCRDCCGRLLPLARSISV